MRIASGKGTAGIINLPKTQRVNAHRLSNAIIQSFASDGILCLQNNQWQTIAQQPGLGLEGLTLSNNVVNPATRVNVAAGTCWLTIGSPQLATLVSTLTKRLDTAWATGTNQGGCFVTPPGGSSQTFHVFLIKNNLTGVVDAGFDTSATASNRPSGWSARRLGSVLWTGSTIRPFIQHGWMFEHNPPVVDLAGVEIPTSLTLYTLSVPSGISVDALCVLSAGTSLEGTALTIAALSPNQSGITPVGTPIQGTFRGHVACSSNAGALVILTNTMFLSVKTNSSAQIALIRSGSYRSSTHHSCLVTHGWYDYLLLSGS